MNKESRVVVAAIVEIFPERMPSTSYELLVN